MRAILIGLVLLFSSTAIQTKPLTNHSIKLEEIKCLAANIHFEARGESKRGQIAVGHVTLNRVKNKNFPKTICNVVKQPGQFSWYRNIDISKVKIEDNIYDIALGVLLGKYKDPTAGSLYFHNNTVDAFNRREKTRIGAHIFYG